MKPYKNRLLDSQICLFISKSGCADFLPNSPVVLVLATFFTLPSEKILSWKQRKKKQIRLEKWQEQDLGGFRGEFQRLRFLFFFHNFECSITIFKNYEYFFQIRVVITILNIKKNLKSKKIIFWSFFFFHLRRRAPLRITILIF